MDVSTRDRGVFLFGPFRLDPVRRTLMRDGVPVSLAPRLFDTLLHLVANHERLVEKSELLAAVWGRRNVEEANLSQAIFGLRKVLQAGGGEDTIIVTAPGRGYRCGVPVVFETAAQDISAAMFGLSETSTPAADSATKSWWRRTAAVTIAALTILLAAACVVVWEIRFSAGPNASTRAALFAPPPHSVAVLAFSNLSGDPGQEYFSDGISEELIDALGRIGDIRVAARQSSFSFKGKSATIAEIARLLNVATVLEGSVRRDGARLRVTTQLIDAATGYQLWSDHYDKALGDSFGLQAEIAGAVIASLRTSVLAKDVAKLTLGGTKDPAAFDAYLRGVTLGSTFTAASAKQAAAAYEEAILKDPHFALALTRHADMELSIAEYFPEDDGAASERTRATALTEARRAVELAPELGMAHVTLGSILLADWDFTGAGREYERARELAPGDAFQNRRWAVFQSDLGHKAEALAAAQRSVELDPLSKGAYMDLASVLTWTGNPDDALVALHHAEQLGASGVRVLNQTAQIMLQKGDFVAARKICSAERNWFDNYCLALADHALGDIDSAQAQLAKLRAIMRDDGGAQYVDIYAQWGRPEDALHWLEHAYQVHDDGLIDMKVDFYLNPIRTTQRYKDVERKMNFPP